MYNGNLTSFFCCVHKAVVTELVWDNSKPRFTFYFPSLWLHPSSLWNYISLWPLSEMDAGAGMLVYTEAWGGEGDTVTACGDGICGACLCYPCVPMSLTSDNEASPSPPLHEDMHFVFNCNPSEVFLSICINCQGWFFYNICYIVNDIKYSKSSVCCFWMTRYLWDKISVGVESCRYADQGSMVTASLGNSLVDTWADIDVKRRWQWSIIMWAVISGEFGDDPLPHKTIFHGWGPCSGGLQLCWALEMALLLGPWETGLIQAVGLSLWKLVTATVSDWHH